MPVSTKQSRSIEDSINVLLNILFAYRLSQEDKNDKEVQGDRFVYNNGIKILL